MKKYAALLLFFLAGISLYAQIQSSTYRDATIYIPPVTGNGSTPKDNELITNQIIEHLENLNYLPVRSLHNAAFTLFAIIAQQDAPLTDPFNGLPIYQSQSYVLNIELMDNKTGANVMKQNLYYSEPDEILNLLKLNFNLVPFATEVTEIKVAPPEIEEDPEEWRSKMWYICAGAFWTPRVYEGDYESTYYVNFGYGIWTEFHLLKFAKTEKTKFLNYLSLGTGVELVPDWVAVRERESYRDLLLEIPLLINGVFKPSGYFMLSPYAGVNFNIALYRDTNPPPVAWRLGFQYGIKVWNGILVIDPWFSMDIGKSSISSNRHVTYQRYMMHIGVKYKYGFDYFESFLWFMK